jgi:hypothetical protein
MNLSLTCAYGFLHSGSECSRAVAQRNFSEHNDGTTVTTIQEKRNEVSSKAATLHALWAFTWQLGEPNKDFLQRARAAAGDGTARELKGHLDALNKNIEHVGGLAHLRVKAAFLGKWMETLGEPVLSGRAPRHIPKWFIDERLFGKLGAVISGWDELPAHAMLVLDFSGSSEDFYIPEAVLFEDMCCTFNKASLSRKDFHLPSVTKAEVKEHYCYVRTAILSAFYFVEAVLNGVAFDFLKAAHRELSHEDEDLLREWDSKRGRERFVAFRDKALKYPRIILRNL